MGSMPEKECVRQSGFLELPFDSGVSEMDDKEFVIGDLLPDINVELKIPPFLGKGKFTSSHIAEA